MNAKVSIYDIAFNYISYFYTRTDTIDKKQIISNIGQLLKEGWTSSDIVHNLYSTPSLVDTSDLLEYFKMCTRTTYNLLNPSIFYYHNELRIVNDMPRIIVDLDTGSFVRKIEDYYLEMRASYTIEELYQYFINKENLHVKETLNNGRLKGSLKWLVDTYDIDTVLFMIDITSDLISSKGHNNLKNPMDIQDNFNEAKEARHRKHSESRMIGEDRVHPKKRTLFEGDK